MCVIGIFIFGKCWGDLLLCVWVWVELLVVWVVWNIVFDVVELELRSIWWDVFGIG